MTLLPPSSSPAAPSPDRRTLLRGAAWTIPAISLATAVPAYAASSAAAVPQVAAALFWPPTEEEVVALEVDRAPEGWTMGFFAQFTAPDDRSLAEPVQLDFYVPEAWRPYVTEYRMADNSGEVTFMVDASEGEFGPDGRLALAGDGTLGAGQHASVLFFLKMPPEVVYDASQSFSLTVWPPSEGMSVALGSVMSFTRYWADILGHSVGEPAQLLDEAGYDRA